MIDYVEPHTEEDRFYVKNILSKDVFKKNIGVINSYDSNILIIVVNGFRNGIVIINQYKIGDFMHSEPLFFIEKRSIYSQRIIFQAINKIFLNPSLISVIFKVYSDNLTMVNMMSIVKIPKVGEIIDVDDRKNRNLCIYQLNKDDYMSMYEEYSFYV